jgi:hypothetical protein
MDDNYAEKVDITAYPKSVGNFKKFVAAQWTFFKEISDQETI